MQKFTKKGSLKVKQMKSGGFELGEDEMEFIFDWRKKYINILDDMGWVNYQEIWIWTNPLKQVTDLIVITEEYLTFYQNVSFPNSETITVLPNITILNTPLQTT